MWSLATGLKRRYSLWISYNDLIGTTTIWLQSRCGHHEPRCADSTSSFSWIWGDRRLQYRNERIETSKVPRPCQRRLQKTRDRTIEKSSWKLDRRISASLALMEEAKDFGGEDNVVEMMKENPTIRSSLDVSAAPSSLWDVSFTESWKRTSSGRRTMKRITVRSATVNFKKWFRLRFQITGTDWMGWLCKESSCLWYRRTDHNKVFPWLMADEPSGLS